MLGKDKDGSLKEVAEQTRPDSRSSLAEPPPHKSGSRGDLKRKRQAQPLGTAGSQSSQQAGGQVPR